MSPKWEEYIGLSYALQVVPDQTTDGFLCYLALHPELPGCMSHGDTPEEAVANLSEARRLYIMTLLEKGEDVPLPTAFYTAIWQVETPVAAVTEEERSSFIPTAVNPIASLDQDREEVAVTD